MKNMYLFSANFLKEVSCVKGAIFFFFHKELLLFATAWMELENIMLSEISQSEKDKYHMISLICGI